MKCRVCGCTDMDCRRCVERTGEPCSWVFANLCSACTPSVELEVMPVAQVLCPSDGYRYVMKTQQEFAITVWIGDNQACPPEWRRLGYRRGRLHVVATSFDKGHAAGVIKGFNRKRATELGWLPVFVTAVTKEAES